jgi:hypothetical protein
MNLVPQHDRYDFVPIVERKDYSWPDGRRLAFTITVNVEWYAFCAGKGHDLAKQGEPQTHRNYAWRDYGNRIGIWRLFDLFESLDLRVAHAANSILYAFAPQIMEAARRRGDEIVGHGRTNAEDLRGVWEADEARLIREATETIAKHEGRPPQGWMGTGAYETPHTLDLLKEAGYQYVMDWPMDDQPIWLRTRSGPILSVPYPIELNDSQFIIHRQASASEFCEMIVDQFDEMVEQAATAPLVMNVSLHTFAFGQPYRLRLLRNALRHCVEHARKSDVWWTLPGAIADYCCNLPPGFVPGI